MIGPLIGIGGIANILIFAELLRVTKIIRHGELLRKFVHISTGMFAASWAFFMSFETIQVLCVLLLIAVIISKRLSIFKSVHDVKRLTYGEELFPIGILLAATLANSEWVYVAAVLHLGMADGLAATTGILWAKKRFKYKVWGQTKSLLGSITFYLTSLSITAAALYWGSLDMGSMAVWILVVLPVAATLLEGIAVFGTDDMLVPLLVTIVLNTL